MVYRWQRRTFLTRYVYLACQPHRQYWTTEWLQIRKLKPSLSILHQTPSLPAPVFFSVKNYKSQFWLDDRLIDLVVKKINYSNIARRSVIRELLLFTAQLIGFKLNGKFTRPTANTKFYFLITSRLKYYCLFSLFHVHWRLAGVSQICASSTNQLTGWLRFRLVHHACNSIDH